MYFSLNRFCVTCDLERNFYEENVDPTRGGALALSLCFGRNTAEASNSRQSNIKSHGTLEYTDGEQDVLFTSEDLLYLARECDKLDEIIQGLSLDNNASISYVYHEHTGSASEQGGCYNKGSHVHTSSCATTSKQCLQTFPGDNPPNSELKCPSCGGHLYHDNGSYVCYNRVKAYACGNRPLNKWSINCGWKEGEIERAEIVFSPK